MGEKLTQEELAAIQRRDALFEPPFYGWPSGGVDAGNDRRKLLAHTAELEADDAARRKLHIEYHDDTEKVIAELREAAAELLAELPSCDEIGCDEPATRHARPGFVFDAGYYCDKHIDGLTTIPIITAAPAARLRALLGKAGA